MVKFLFGILLLALVTSCNNAPKENTHLNQEKVDTLTQTLATETSAKSDSLSYPSFLNPFILPDYKVLKYVKGDLDKDNQEDILLVLAQKNEAENGDALRPLLILTQNPDKNYTLNARNDSIVDCRTCGGRFDPFIGITIKNDYFTIEQEGGSRERWTKYITFKFSDESKTWLLHRIDETAIDTLNEKDKGTTKVRTTKDFGKILFNQYCFEKMDKQGLRI